MTAKRIGFWLGMAGFALTILTAPPAGMPAPAWPAAGLVWWMALWWMTEAIPLYATAILPFLVLPLTGVANAARAASAYYSPIMFLFIGGAFLAIAIERTGLHRRLALFIMNHSGNKPWQLLLAVMAATGMISSVISNTSTALIMMPMALAMLTAGGVRAGETDGFAGALPMGIAFAASIGGLATMIGTPTNAISVALLRETLGVRISFLDWMTFGVPIVVLGIPLAAWIIARVQRIADAPFDPVAARTAIAHAMHWTKPEHRLVPIVIMAMSAWIATPLIEPLFPAGGFTDGTVAAIAGLVLFVLPDGTGRPMLVWAEANRAPWDVVLMFGGGLAMAMGMTESGLADWLGQMLMPLANVPLPVVVLAIVAFVILTTEFASNIASASAIMPIVAALTAAFGSDPLLLALPAALAASWGFMLPAGTGPNAIAWGTGHLRMPLMLRAGLLLDATGALLIIGVVWGVVALS